MHLDACEGSDCRDRGSCGQGRMAATCASVTVSSVVKLFRFPTRHTKHCANGCVSSKESADQYRTGRKRTKTHYENAPRKKPSNPTATGAAASPFGVSKKSSKLLACTITPVSDESCRRTRQACPFGRPFERWKCRTISLIVLAAPMIIVSFSITLPSGRLTCSATVDQTAHPATAAVARPAWHHAYSAPVSSDGSPYCWRRPS